MYRVDELLLIELLTYMPGTAPLISILDAEGMTVGDYLGQVDLNALDDEFTYSTQMNGFDFRNIIMAILNNPTVSGSRILESHLDMAYGAGGGVLPDEKSGNEESAMQGGCSGDLSWGRLGA